MEIPGDLEGESNRPAPWPESTESSLVGHSSPRPQQILCRLQHYYGLEDILPEEELEEAMQICKKIEADDGREWYFPEEIWERIMKRVLFQDLLCWRRVCKKWNLAFVAHEWSSEENRHSQAIIPLISRCKERSAADFSLLALKPDYGKWFSMDIGHALACLHLYCGDGKECLPCFRCTTIASLGLLILSCSCGVHWNSHLCLVICNPVTMQVKPLIVPQAENIFQREVYFRLAGVIEFEGTNDKHYKLLFSTVYRNFLESFSGYCVYDSKTSSWRFGRGPALFGPCIFSKASCGGCIYFLHRKGVEGQRVVSKPYISKYDSETDTWSEIAWLPQQVGGERLPQLVQCGGVIMLVAHRRCCIRQGEALYHTKLVFYKLNESTSSVLKLWTYAQENESMPYSLVGSSTVASQNYDAANVNWLIEDSRCEGHGDNVFFYNLLPCTSHNAEQPWSSESTGMCKNGSVLLFDRKARTWLFLPKCYPFHMADYAMSIAHKLELFRPSLMEP